jgi:uncharacterized membrane protein (UPF0127 family)
VYYFSPHKEFSLRKTNNSSLVRKIAINKCEDVTFIELSPVWEDCKEKVEKTCINFDVIMACGESDQLKLHAEIETIAKEGDKRLKNQQKFPNLKYIKKNTVYDNFNDYTCNKLNFHLLHKRKQMLVPFSFVFIHVPVSTFKNKEIVSDFQLLLKKIREKYRKHHSVSVNVEKVFEDGYTGVNENKDCIKGIHFPFDKFQIHEMTMADTGIDLDIIYLAEKKKGHFKILKIIHAKAYSKRVVEHMGFSVLEMPSKYCEKNHVKMDNLLKLVT